MSEVTCLSEILAAQLQVLCILCPVLWPYLLLSLFKWIITGSTSRKSSTRHIQTASAYVKSHKSTPEYVEFVHRCSELSRAILYFSSPIWSNPIGKKNGNAGFPFRRGKTFFWLIPHCDKHKCWYRKYYLKYIYYITLYYIILSFII